jgi:hypothetical protein
MHDAFMCCLSPEKITFSLIIVIVVIVAFASVLFSIQKRNDNL